MMFLNIPSPQNRNDESSRSEDEKCSGGKTHTVPSISAQQGCFAVTSTQSPIRDVALGAMDDTRKGPFLTCFDGPNLHSVSVMRHGMLLRGIKSAFFGADESGVGPIRAKTSRLKMSTPRCICITRNAVAVGYSSGAVRLWERKSNECRVDYKKSLELKRNKLRTKSRSKSCSQVDRNRVDKLDLASGDTNVQLLAELGYHLNRNVVSIQASDDSFNQDLLISNNVHEVVLWGQADKLVEQIKGLKKGEGLVPLWRKTLEHSVEQAAVLSIAQDSYLIACTQLHDVELFEQRGDNRRSLGRLKGHTGKVSCVRFGSWGGISLFTGSYDGTIRLWTPQVFDQKLLSIECVAVIETSKNWIMDLALSHRQHLIAVSKDCVSVYSLREAALSFAKNGSWLNGRWMTNVGELEVKGGKGSALSYRWIGNVIVQKSEWYLYNMDVSDQGRTVHGWWGVDNRGTCGQFKLTGTKGSTLEEDEFTGSFWRDCEEIKSEWRGRRCVQQKRGRNFVGRPAATPSRNHGKSIPRSPNLKRGTGNNGAFRNNGQGENLSSVSSIKKQDTPRSSSDNDAGRPAASSSNEEEGGLEQSDRASSSSSSQDGPSGTENPPFSAVECCSGSSDEQHERIPANSISLSPLLSHKITLCLSNSKPATKVTLVEKISLPNPGTCVDVHFSGRRMVVGTVNGEICTYSSDWFHRRSVIMVRRRLLNMETTTPEFMAFAALARAYSAHGIPAGHWTQLPEELFRHMVRFI